MDPYQQVRRPILLAAAVTLIVVASCSNGAPSEFENQSSVALVQGLPDEVTSDEFARSAEAESSEDSSPQTAILGWDRQRTLIIAEQSLVSACMEDAGFLYQVVEPPVVPDVGRGTSYGSDDVETLSVSGYGLGSTNDQPIDPNAELVQTLSEQDQGSYTLALFGNNETGRSVEVGGITLMTNADGCLADARAQLFGDQFEWLRLTATIDLVRSDVVSLVLQDEAFLQVLVAWSGCMAGEGYDFADPSEARLAALDAYRAGSSDAGEIELRIATADAACGAAVDLLGVAATLEATYLEEVLSDREGEVLAYRELTANAIDRWKALLGE